MYIFLELDKPCVVEMNRNFLCTNGKWELVSIVQKKLEDHIVVPIYGILD
jgi:hypothetical protein